MGLLQDIPIYLAPLRGVTLRAFRDEMRARFGGVTAAVAPFIALGAPGKFPPKFLADVMPVDNAFTIPQVIGKDPQALRDAAAALRDAGYTRLNLNSGCPWKFVAKKGRGSGLIENADVFERMLEAGCEAMPGGFSVKVRLGYASPTTLLQRVEILNRYPLTAVIIHPRTGQQMYEGTVYIDHFAEVLPLLKAPVIYNGDIFTRADAATILERFPSIAGLMIGRGLCRNPALAESIRTGATVDNRRRILEFATALESIYAEELYGPAPLMGRLKELWSYLHCTFESGDDLLHRIQRSRTLPELISHIRTISLC